MLRWARIIIDHRRRPHVEKKLNRRTWNLFVEFITRRGQLYLLSNNQDFLRSEEHEWEYKTPVEVSFAVQRPE